ncbi:MAG: hypothetical protein QMC81_04085 [Thermoanaerobacterales bacterium]|nr:hypothetical protein [Bacillota bacterium]MDI6906657.1 hypothetical protein [Thermoanaerobacterales bacterium]
MPRSGDERKPFITLLRAPGKGGPEALERACRAALERDERLSGGWFVVGMLCLQRGDVEEAYESLSEFTSLESAGEEARRVEILLYYLESLETVGSELGEELGEEMAIMFLEAFGASLPPARRLLDLGGIGPREAVRTPAGRRLVLRLLQEQRVFLREAVEYARRFLPEGTLQEWKGDDY